ncbi:glycogen synthase isoform 1 [Terramyces sp. JEL0728]|nr:glycogen synthase isoform 1 [Terramyces sp. JEL0728]
MDSDITRPILFEIAWEVANKVGGIYTVIKSKAPVTCKEYGDRYCLIGPLSHKTASMEVEEIEPPTPAMAKAIQCVRDGGVHCLFGKWLIPGAPYVLLFDIGSAGFRKNEWKGDLWNVAGIPSPEGDIEMDDAIVFGYLVTWFLGEFHAAQKYLESRTETEISQIGQEIGKPVVIAHFHEWLAGVGLVLIRKRNMEIATIFTTHATLLGRYLCAGDVDFYNNLKFFDVDAEAGKRGIYHRYCVERAAAHCADVFTTVSKITAYESEWLLKRQPDGVLPNGLNVVKFQAIHEFQNLHAKSKESIHEFIRGHFFGHYHFDLDNTLYFFTAGRYEFRNKGVDMFIESLARLNARLKEVDSPINVVAFIIMPAKNRSYTAEALRGQAEMKSLRQTVNKIQQAVGQRIFEAASRSEIPKSAQLLSEEDIVMLKGRIYASKRGSLPPIVTHNMEDDHHDNILSALRNTHLINQKDDKVKVVFHPEFLNSNSPLLSIDYEDFLRGCHMGVFPSYYEPWGYTPAECTVMGVPSITTNLSGFGCFMSEVITYPSDYGIYIVDRRAKGVEDSLNQLTDYMFDFCQKTRRQRINQRNRCERLSDVLDWKRMGLEYVKARWVAIRRKFPALANLYDEVHFDDSDDGLSSDFQSGYESDASPFTENREDLQTLGKRQKVPRPVSIPGSPIRKSEDFLENVPIAHLFDETEKVNVNVILDELKNLGMDE